MLAAAEVAATLPGTFHRLDRDMDAEEGRKLLQYLECGNDKPEVPRECGWKVGKVILVSIVVRKESQLKIHEYNIMFLILCVITTASTATWMRRRAASCCNTSSAAATSRRCPCARKRSGHIGKQEHTSEDPRTNPTDALQVSYSTLRILQRELGSLITRDPDARFQPMAWKFGKS